MFITQPKIFISSTLVDLPNERKAVEKAGGFPVMSGFTMEAQATLLLRHVCLRLKVQTFMFLF